MEKVDHIQRLIDAIAQGPSGPSIELEMEPVSWDGWHYFVRYHDGKEEQGTYRLQEDGSYLLEVE